MLWFTFVCPNNRNDLQSCTFRSTALRVELVQNKNDEKYDVLEHFDIKFPNGLVINQQNKDRSIYFIILKTALTFFNFVLKTYQRPVSVIGAKR